MYGSWGWGQNYKAQFLPKGQWTYGPTYCRTSAIYGLWGFMGICIDSINFFINPGWDLWGFMGHCWVI